MDVFQILYVVCLALLTSAEVLGTKRFRFRIKKRTFRKHGDVSFGVQPEARLFTQRLDHFRPTDTRTWEQRYWVRTDFFKKGGPVFLYIGGEGEEYASSMTSRMTWETLARRHNALMVILEHRYYGPTGAPYTGEHTRGMRYLSSEQALADLAYFIMQVNEGYGFLDEHTKWVAFGGSYAGILAAWLRYKYPHLVYAAVASSAPIKAQLDFPEYMDTDKTVLQSYPNCFKHVQEILSQVDKLLRTTKGRLHLQEIFGLCSPPEVDTLQDRVSFYTDITSSIVGCAQFGNCEEVCQSMVNSTKANVLQQYANGLHLSIEIPKEHCLDVSYSSPQINNEASNRHRMHRWTYQTCTEFGYFQTSEKQGALLGNRVPLKSGIQKCANLFGPKFTKSFIQDAVDWTNNNYGGLRINVTRVIFVHGTADPWHRLGLNKTTNPESPVIIIEGTSHCADMDYATGPPALLAAQRRIADILVQWLGQPYSDA